jgi:hypothetical protein
VLAAGACAACALAAFPSLVTETGRVVQDVYVHLYLEAASGYDGLDPSGGYAFYARTLAIGLGWPVLVAAAMGLLLALRARDARVLIVASLPIALVGVLGSQRLYFARFALPALPAMVVLAALAIDALLRRNALAGIVALVLALAPSTLDDARSDQLLTRRDTRTLAREWMEANLPTGATLAADAPPLGPAVPPALRLDLPQAEGGALFDLAPDEYRARGIQYLVTSSFTLEARAIDPSREARRESFVPELNRVATLVAEFRPYVGDVEPPFAYDDIYAPYHHLGQLQRPGPLVRIYRFN